MSQTHQEATGPIGYSPSLVGYAMLRANYNAGGARYIDNFSDFLLAVLDATTRAMSRSEISEVVRKRFGLSIPSLVVGKILKGLRKADLVAEVHADGYRITPKGKGAVPEIEETAQKVRARQLDLAQEFERFLRDEFPLEHVLVPKGTHGEILVAYIEKHSVRVLALSLRGEEWQSTPMTAQQDYLVSSYVAHIVSSDAQRLEYLEDLAKGAVLASVLTLDTLGFSQSLKGTCFYLDTPVVLNLVGLHGGIPQVATEQLVKLMLGQGARVAVFEHTMREVSTFLDGVEHSLSIGSRSGSTNAVYFHCIENGITAADLRVFSSRLSREIAAYDVVVLPKPEGYDRYGLDENSLESKLQTVVRYKEDATRVFDVDSLSAIHRLRRGIRSSRLEETSAVLVTTNSDLVRAARDFDGDKRRFPLVLTEESIAGLLWVRSPSVSESATRQQLIATAFAGLSPRRQPWLQFLEEVERLSERGEISPEDALVLRSTQSSREAFMEVTVGSATVPVDSPKLVLEKLREDARRAEAELRKAAVDRAVELEAGTNSLSTRIADLELKAAQQAEVLGLESQRKMRVLSRLEERADRFASRVVAGPIAVVFVLLVVAMLTPYLGITESFPLLANIAGGVVAVAVGLALLSTLFGRNAMDITRVLKSWLKSRKLRDLKALLEEESE